MLGAHNNNARQRKVRRTLQAIACTLCLLPVSPTGMTLEVQLIVNEDGVDPEQLSTTELRAIFSMRKRTWEDNSAIRVFVLPDSHPLHQSFCKSLLKVYPYVLRDQWDRIIFSGTGTPPTVVDNTEKLQEMVARTPGAIGYSYSTRSPEQRKQEHANVEDTP